MYTPKLWWATVTIKRAGPPSPEGIKCISGG